MNSSQPFNKHTDDFITIQDFLSLCLSHLSWFVLSFTVIMSMALYYLFSTPDLFTSQAAIMIKEETTGNMSVQKTEGREFNNMALVQNPVSISNIQRQFTSLFLLSDVVRRMNLYNDSSEITGIAQGIRGRLVVSCDDEKSTILNIKYSDYSPKQAKEILTAIIDAFNENWIYEKNQMARSSAHFIDGRLALIEKELGQVDDSISTYKAAHQITDVSRVSDIYLDQQTSSEAEILQLSNRLSMARYVLALLKDKSSNQILLPSNIGLDNADLESQISQYNSQLLKLKSNMVGTSSQNPLILRQQNELSDVRKHILDNVNQLVRTLQMQMNAIQQFNEEAKGKVTSSPEQAKKLISVERDQKVKESLYLYLLQKKEENEISMTYTSVPTQYIDMPHGSSFPTYPNTKSILTSAFIASLLLPMAILFLRESLDNTIHSKEDIENNIINQIDLIPDEDKTEYLCQVNANLAKSTFVFQEHKIHRKDGKDIYVLCSGRMFYDSALQKDRGEIVIVDVSSTYALKMLTDAEQNKADVRLRNWENTYRTDPLTGLLNHAAFRSDMEQRLLECTHTAVMIMMDVDRFKQYNDTYGHHNGDKYLVLVAQALQAALRGDDHACRMGGDEFAAMLFFNKSVSDDVIRERAQQIFDKVNLTVKATEGGTGISMGAVIARTELTFNEMYEEADNALYDVKESGRGRIEVKRHGE